MQEVARQRVDEQRIAQALDDIEGRAFGRWHRLRHDGLTQRGLRQMCGELLAHVAARDPALATAEARTVLRTAAECAFGVLDLGVFPKKEHAPALRTDERARPAAGRPLRLPARGAAAVRLNVPSPVYHLDIDVRDVNGTRIGAYFP